MAKTTLSSRQILAAGLGTSLLVSSLSAGIGLCALNDVSEHCVQLKNQYLQRRQIALAAVEELTRVTRSPLRGADPAAQPSAQPDAAGQPLDPVATLLPLVRAAHAYEALGTLRANEAAQLGVLKRSLIAYRRALEARQDVPAASGPQANVATAHTAVVRSLDRLASIAGERASEFDAVLSEAIANISRLFMLIGVLAILAGIPPALWIMRVCQGKPAAKAGLQLHPANAAIC